jgi:ATP-dependent protease ClpP protease subunit
MKHWKTALLLVVIGLLLSFSKASNTATDKGITLTEDNHIVFSGKVDDESVAKAQIEIAKISTKLERYDVIYLVIDSPGGSVPAGNRFIDFANSLPQKIKPICLFCASMGYHMFQSFDERLVYSSSELMSHRVAIGGLSGQVPGEAVTRLNDIINVSNKMDRSVAARIGIDVKAYQALIYNELWLDGDEAVKTHHADRIAKIKCSEELVNNQKSQTFNTLFGPVEAKFSTCPLISGFIDLQFKKEQFRSRDEAVREIRKFKRSITVEY